MKKISAIILSLALVFAMTITAFAAPATTEKRTTKSIPDHEIWATNHEIKRLQDVVIAEDALLVVEEGTTVYIYGNLYNKGTLTNNGTIVLLPAKETLTEGQHAAGRLINTGVINNDGTIKISAGNLTNAADAVVNNNKTIIVTADYNGKTAITNLYRAATAGKEEEYGVFNNNGTLTLSNTKGIGYYSYDGAVTNNSGKITAVSKNSAQGKINDKKVVIVKN